MCQKLIKPLQRKSHVKMCLHHLQNWSKKGETHKNQNWVLASLYNGCILFRILFSYSLGAQPTHYTQNIWLIFGCGCDKEDDNFMTVKLNFRRSFLLTIANMRCHCCSRQHNHLILIINKENANVFVCALWANDCRNTKQEYINKLSYMVAL